MIDYQVLILFKAMKTNQIWFRVSTTAAALTGIVSLIHGFTYIGIFFLVVAGAEYMLANYILKMFKQS